MLKRNISDKTAKVITVAGLIGMGLIAANPFAWGVVTMASGVVILNKEKQED